MADYLVASTSKFHIYSSFSLSPDDVSTLSLLYTPLMGSDAFTLYMVFYSLLERNNLKSESILHQDLFDIYALRPIDFMKSKNKLEGIGLLLTYEKDGDYIYVLLPPVSPKNFIKDTTYGLYLYGKVRKETFYFLKKHFEIEKPETEGYQNVTKSFDDVFASITLTDKTYEKFSYLLGKSQSPGINIKNNDFNFDLFLKEINQDYLEAGVTTKFKDQIVNMAYVYGFNEHTMACLYQDSINKLELYDYKILKKKANTRFAYERNMSAPKLMVKKDNKEEETDLVRFMEKATPVMILASVNPNYPTSYLETVNDIYTSIGLPRGVINCMIFKTMKDKGGELPNLAYFKKVADSWVLENILTTYDAINYITMVKEAKPKTKSGATWSSGTTQDVNDGWEEL